MIVAGRKSDQSLYDASIATMESGAAAYDQSDATGFIRLNALRLRLRAAVHNSKKTPANGG
jgi:argininosuccinate synthase